MQPQFIDQFYHDGRGPELQRVHYKFDGQILVAIDYYLADKPYTQENLRHLLFIKTQVFMFTPEEVESYEPRFNPWEGKQRFALVNFGKSEWQLKFNQRHLAKCSHFRCMFYDEFLDVICEEIKVEYGGFTVA